jgi:hypothetical protein
MNNDSMTQTRNRGAQHRWYMECGRPVFPGSKGNTDSLAPPHFEIECVNDKRIEGRWIADGDEHRSSFPISRLEGDRRHRLPMATKKPTAPSLRVDAGFKLSF